MSKNAKKAVVRVRFKGLDERVHDLAARLDKIEERTFSSRQTTFVVVGGLATALIAAGATAALTALLP
jgi:hypothetical protein